MAHPPTEAGPPPAKLGRRQVLVVFVGLSLAVLLAALDQTIVATALPTIVSDLGGLELLSWVVTAYLITLSVSMPLYGKLGDLYGRKPVFLFAILVFVVGSALSGLTQSMVWLVAFRAVQGLGASGLLVGAQAIIADIVSPRARGRYQGLMGAVVGLTSIAGPLAGGFFTDQLSWRWVFYINLPVGALAFAVLATALKLPRPTTRPRIDYLGAVLLGAALTCIVLFTSWGGTQYAWDSPAILSLAAVGAVLLGLWVVAERYVAEPIIPRRLFRSGTFSISTAVSLILGLAMFGAITFLPLFLQIVSGASATNAGLLLLPMMGGLIIAAGVSGQVITVTGHYKWSLLAGTAIAAGALYLLSTMDAAVTRFTSGVYMVVLGVGIGLVIQVVVVAVQNTASRQDVGAATSTVNVARSIGGAVGVAAFAAIFTNRLGEELAQRLPAGAAAKVPDTASISPEVVHRLPPGLQRDFEVGVAQALTPAFAFAVPLLGVAFLLTLLLKEHPLRDTSAPPSS